VVNCHSTRRNGPADGGFDRIIVALHADAVRTEVELVSRSKDFCEVRHAGKVYVVAAVNVPGE
jgi:hypothetical protein